MKRQVADRLFLAALGALTSGISLAEPESLAYTMVQLGGLPATVCSVLLAGLVVAVAADTVVNDVLPAEYSWRCGVRYRQALWMALAVLYAVQAWVMLRYRAGEWLAGVYVLYALRCAGVAFLDLWHDHMAAQRNRRATDRQAGAARTGEGAHA